MCVHLCVKMKRPQGHSTALRAVEEQLDGFNGLIANAHHQVCVSPLCWVIGQVQRGRKPRRNPRVQPIEGR